jgi:hypothetical protein
VEIVFKPQASTGKYYESTEEEREMEKESRKNKRGKGATARVGFRLLSCQTLAVQARRFLPLFKESNCWHTTPLL